MKEDISQTPITAHLPEAWKPRHRDDLVRLGSKSDGGYVVTETAIRNTDLLLGLGVEGNWSFEQEFHERSGCTVHCYDHTIGFFHFLKASARHLTTALRIPRTPDIHQIFFPLKYWRFFSGDKKHFMEKVGNDPGSSSDFRKIFSRVPDSSRVFIKMDIEGGEYQVLSGLSDYFPRVTGLVIEFHHLIFLHDRMDEHIGDLNQSFDIVHIHANNCRGADERGLPDVIEITFENRNLRNGDERESEREYPVEGLDYPNAIEFYDYKLLFDGELSRQAD
jgi:Methyltransferase FkbM domain